MEEMKNPEPVDYDDQMQEGDRDLREIGVKMQDMTGDELNPNELRAERKPEPLWPEAPMKNWEEEPEEDRKNRMNAEKVIHLLGRVLALAVADTMLAMMCLTGKIDLAYGLLFLAGTSAVLGAKVEHARL